MQKFSKYTTDKGFSYVCFMKDTSKTSVKIKKLRMEESYSNGMMNFKKKP